MTSLLTEATENLRGKVKGRLVLPDHPNYAEVRKIWNAMIDRRPAVIVQADRNNARLSSVIVAQITSNVARAEHEPTQFLIQRGTPAARAAGLLTDSAIKCETLATISKRRIIKRIGHLLPEQM